MTTFKRMKSFLLLPIFLVLGGCESTPAPTTSAPARYASPEEIERLRLEARANFERERERQGGGAALASNAPRSTAPRVAVSTRTTGRRSWTAAEVRYAFAIGKSPADLTAGERAAAQSE